MANHEDTSTQLSNKYERRAKFAAWFSGLSLFSISAFELSSAQPALAGESAGQRAEATPKDMIAKIDKRIMSMLARVRANRHVKDATTKDNKDKVHAYYLYSKNKANPHHYDVVEFITQEGQNFPTGIAVGVGAKSNTYKDFNHAPNAMIISQSPEGRFDPNYIEMLAINGPKVQRYCISAESNSDRAPSFGFAKDIASSFGAVNSSVVSQEYATFFNTAETIIKANSD